MCNYPDKLAFHFHLAFALQDFKDILLTTREVAADLVDVALLDVMLDLPGHRPVVVVVVA